MSDGYYDEYPEIEDELNAALAESLHPRSPGHVNDVIAALGLPRSALVVDLGCGEGDHSIELARRFGFAVRGIDPVERHVRLSTEKVTADLDISFTLGSTALLPFDDGTVDLVHIREVLYHVTDLESAFCEVRRVLRPGGRVVNYQLYSTERLEPREAAWFWDVNGTHPSSADLANMERAIAAGGLRIVDDVVLDSETGEWAEETNGKASRELLAISRMLREPDRYIERFGRRAYDIKLADAQWHVFRMLGKLSNHIHVLAPA